MTRHLRLVLGLGIAVALPFAPWVTRSEGLTLAAAALTYVIGSWVVEAIAARRPGFPARALIPLLGLVVITVVMVAIPRTLEAGLALFVLGVAFSTYVAGRTLGLWLSVGAVSAAVVAVYLAPEADRVDGATLLAFAMVVPLVAVVVDRLTAERRRTATALSRLHDELGAAEAQPDLAATLDSIASSIGHAVHATVALVMLHDVRACSRGAHRCRLAHARRARARRPESADPAERSVASGGGRPRDRPRVRRLVDSLGAHAARARVPDTRARAVTPRW